MKTAIIAIMSNVSTSTTHHGGGYGNIIVKIIKELNPSYEIAVNPDPSTWNEYDNIYIAEGVNFQEGSFNVPGGPQPEHTQKMLAIANYKGQIRHVAKTMDFDGFNKRLKLDVTFPTQPITIDYPRYYGSLVRKIVIGDSHSLSVWKPGYGLDRTDGRTLHGFLNRTTPDELNEKYDETVTYFGNIDLRFHLMRQPDPVQATKDLINRYLDFSSKLTKNTLVQLLPIEHESRKLPGTGLYLKQPFFGTRQERMELRDIANTMIAESGMPYLSWPTDWVDEDGMKMFEYMEPKQSVHLKPKYYQFINQILA